MYVVTVNGLCMDNSHLFHRMRKFFESLLRAEINIGGHHNHNNGKDIQSQSIGKIISIEDGNCNWYHGNSDYDEKDHCDRDPCCSHLCPGLAGPDLLVAGY